MSEQDGMQAQERGVVQKQGSEPADEAAKVQVAPEGLEGLGLQAPPDTLERFRKRASLWLGTRYVLERQVYGFWIVLHTLLRLLFKRGSVPVAGPGKQQASRYRRLLQNSKEERP